MMRILRTTNLKKVFKPKLQNGRFCFLLAASDDYGRLKSALLVLDITSQ